MTFQGIHAALVTPFTASGKVAPAVLKAFLVEEGLVEEGLIGRSGVRAPLRAPHPGSVGAALASYRAPPAL